MTMEMGIMHNTPVQRVTHYVMNARTANNKEVKALIAKGCEFKFSYFDKEERCFISIVEGEYYQTVNGIEYRAATLEELKTMIECTQNETIHALNNTKEETAMELTFAFDCEINDEKYIPAGTKVTVYNHPIKKQDSTWIIYNGNRYEFMNVSFVELNERYQPTTKDIEVQETLETAKELDVSPHNAVKQSSITDSYRNMMSYKHGSLFKCLENGKTYLINEGRMGKTVKCLPDTIAAVPLHTIDNLNFTFIGVHGE